MENKELVKELEQDEGALTLCAGATLATTGVMIADLSIKASGFAAGLPAEGVMYLGGLLLIASGGMTLSYIARQNTMMKVKNVLERETVQTVAKAEAPVGA